jgi:C4-type Zn-finger protein
MIFGHSFSVHCPVCGNTIECWPNNEKSIWMHFKSVEVCEECGCKVQIDIRFQSNDD